MVIGLYGDSGTETCSGYPGSSGYETTDANTLAGWGIDFWKYDNVPLSSPQLNVTLADSITCESATHQATHKPVTPPCATLSPPPAALSTTPCATGGKTASGPGVLQPETAGASPPTSQTLGPASSPSRLQTKLTRHTRALEGSMISICWRLGMEV